MGSHTRWRDNAYFFSFRLLSSSSHHILSLRGPLQAINHAFFPLLCCSHIIQAPKIVGKIPGEEKKNVSARFVPREASFGSMALFRFFSPLTLQPPFIPFFSRGPCVRVKCNRFRFLSHIVCIHFTSFLLFKATLLSTAKDFRVKITDFTKIQKIENECKLCFVMWKTLDKIIFRLVYPFNGKYFYASYDLPRIIYGPTDFVYVIHWLCPMIPLRLLIQN